MDCCKSNEYMMRYMDATLSEEAAARLSHHVEQCAACKEDFLAYDEIMTGFSEMELICAPDGFEEIVMAHIRLLPSVAVLRPDQDTLLCLIWGTVSVLFGSGFIVFLNRAAIMEALAQNPAFSRYVEILPPVSERVYSFVDSTYQVLYSTVSSVYAYVSGYRYLLLVVFGILAAAQYIIYKKDKVGA